MDTTELYNAILAEFEKGVSENRPVAECLEAIKKRTATFKDAAKYADEIGEICSNALKGFLNGEHITQYEFDYAMANGAITPMLKRLSDMGADVATDIQKLLNEKSNIGLAAQKPKFNQEAAENLARKAMEVVQEEGLERLEWVIDEPVRTFSRKVIDDAIKANVEFQARAGLNPIIRRTLGGKCCDWCKGLAGAYNYGEEPDDIYRRHERCRCMVEFFPGDGRRQNVHSKKWSG